MRLNLCICFILFSFSCFSQAERSDIRKGNEAFFKNDLKTADSLYNSAIKKTPGSFEAEFNKADALYKQKKYAEAEKKFESLAKRNISSALKSKVYHNLGNSQLQERKYEESINSYKKALKLNSKDEDARYNLSYALKKLQEQKQDQQNNKDNKDNKDQQKKDQDKKEQDKNKKDKKEDQKKEQEKDKKKDKKEDKENGDGKENKGENEKPKDEMSKEDAKRLLDALKAQEKDAQEKMRKQKAKGVQVEIEKDW